MSSQEHGWQLSASGKISLAVSVALGTQLTAAYAQDTLEEIVVTARKRTENLQDIPESIQALSSERIARAGLQTMDDYVRQIPSMSYVPRGPGANKVVFRGVSEAGTAFFTDSSAAVYLDEQPLTQPSATPEPRLIDIERIEALSGPQGTLYGGSSQSGTLRIVTNKPDTTRFESNVSANFSTGSTSDPSYEVSGVLNMPLADNKFAIRLVGFSAKDGGFIDNVLAESPGGTFDNSAVVGKNIGGEADYKGGRVSARWDINDKWDATASVVYQDTKSNGNTEHNPSVAGDLNQIRFIKEFRNDKWTQYGLTIEGNLGFADLVSATSYFSRDILYQLDNTEYIDYLRSFYVYYGTVAYAFGPADGSTPDPVGLGWINPEKTYRFSQEIRLSHEGEKWGWLAGLYYEKYDDHWDWQSRMQDYEDTKSFAYWYYLYAAYGLERGATNNAFYNSNNHTKTTQYATFGELSYKPNEDWTFTVGGRWFRHTRDRTYYIAQPRGRIDNISHPVVTEENSTVKFSVSYNLSDDKMIYALYSEGYRNGGENITRPGVVLPAQYDPDFLQNYEVGLKSQWAGGKLRLNLTGYHMVWDKYQLGVVDPGPLYAVMIINVGNARINGVELNLSAVPVDGLEFGLDLESLNSKTTSNLDFDFDGITDIAKGARLPASPEFKASTWIQYTFGSMLWGGNPYIRLQSSYYGDSYNGVECNTDNCDPPDYQPSYQISDFKIGIDAQGWEVNLFANNFTDERAVLYAVPGAPRGVITVNRPREYGIGFTKRWGD
jgi:outer membrane receptor protein involved in Fe transport